MAKPLDPMALIEAGPNFDTNTGLNERAEIMTPEDAAEGDKVVDFSKFDDRKSGVDIKKEDIHIDENLKREEEAAAKAAKAEEEAAKAPPKVDDTKADTKKAELEKPQSDKTDEVPTKPRTAREPDAKLPNNNIDVDFKDLVPDTAVPILKKASKETQEFVAAELRRGLKEREELKQQLETAKKSVRDGLPPSWYEHEQAFTLIPEYQTAAKNIGTLKQYSQHYREQLIAIKEREKWADMVVGPDGKISQVIREPDAASEVEVLGKIGDLDRAIAHYQQQAGVVINRFQTQVKTLRDDLKQDEDKYFPQYKDGFDKNENGKYAMNLLAARGLQHNPLAQFTAKIYATLIDVLDENDALKASSEKGKKIAAVNNGPTGGEIDKGEKGSDKVVDPNDMPFDLSKFEEVKVRGHYK